MRKSGPHDLVECDGKVADAFAGGVVDGVGYGGCCSCDAYFADASGPERAEFVVRDVESGDVDLVDVGVDVDFGGDGAPGVSGEAVGGARSVSYEEPAYGDEAPTGKDACKKRAIAGGFEVMMVAFLNAYRSINF
jgi:hypothetical protein